MRPRQVCAVPLGGLGSCIPGRVGTIRALNLWGVGHARPRSRREGRACGVQTRLVGELGMRGRRPGPLQLG